MAQSKHYSHRDFARDMKANALRPARNSSFSDEKFNVGALKIISTEFLPNNTMVVSQDIYKKIKDAINAPTND